MTMADIKDKTKKLKKLRERKVHLEELIEITKDQIVGVETEMRRCGVDIPSEVLKCCGMCQPCCSVHYNDGGCGCHHQCLREQPSNLVIVGEDETSQMTDEDFKIIEAAMPKKTESPDERKDRELDEPIDTVGSCKPNHVLVFDPETDWPRKL